MPTAYMDAISESMPVGFDTVGAGVAILAAVIIIAFLQYILLDIFSEYYI